MYDKATSLMQGCVKGCKGGGGGRGGGGGKGGDHPEPNLL